MKKIIGTLLFLPLAIANAEYSLKDNTEIVGVWAVEAEAPKLDAPKRALNQTWEFKSDGVLVSTSSDPRTNAPFSANLKYQVEDGKIIREKRPGKTETCVVEKKEGSEMILNCGNLYFFLTKK